MAHLTLSTNFLESVLQSLPPRLSLIVCFFTSVISLFEIQPMRAGEGEREGEVAEVDNKVVEAVVVAFSCQQILNDP